MEPKNFICFKCEHYDDFGPGCKAFPEGIPEEITEGTNKHAKPLPGQGNDLVFKPA
jgi:hypothetical protein